MAEKFKFFDPVQREDGTYDREYSAQEFTDYFKTLINTGIMKSAGNQLAVTSNGSSMMTTIDTGIAFILGRYYENDSIKELIHDTESLGNSRIDRVVIRMDLSTEARYVKAFIKKGVPSSNPVPLQLTQTQNIYEISLAQVRIVGGQTFLAKDAITDERGTDIICPWAVSDILPSYNDNALAELTNRFNAHEGNNVSHVTNAERISWNDKKSVRTYGLTTVDPNTATEQVFLTNHSNVQNQGENGEYWYVEQTYYQGTQNRTQWASKYVGSKADFKVRHYYSNDGWSPWSPSLQSLFTSVSNGKSQVANAITDMGVVTSPTAEFATMANNIRAIQTFKFKEQYFTFSVGTAARHQIEFLFDAGFTIKHANIICYDFNYDNNSKTTGKSIFLTAGETSYRQTGGATSGGTILADVSNYLHTNGIYQSVIDGRYVRVRLTYHSSTSISAQTLPIMVQAWG